MKIVTFYGLLLGLLIASQPALAGPKTKLSVLFQDFPSGTKCSATGTKGKVTLNKKRGHPRVKIKGYPEIGTIFCNLPDGRQIITDINKHLRADAKVVGVTIYPNGMAYLTTSASGGLFSEQMSNMIR